MRIVLSGYYGFGNTGDEAVLSATIGGLRRRLPAAEPVVLSASPPATEREHGVEAHPRWPLGQVRRTLRDCDLLLAGGGTLLQDATSLRSLWYYTQVTALARRCGVPYVIFAQGLGPLSTWLGRRWARKCLGHATAITVRDPDSQQLAAHLGAPGAVLAADPAVLLQPDHTARVAQILARLPEGRPVLGIAPRPWRGAEAALVVLGELARAAAQQWGASVLVLPFQPAQDLGAAERVAEGAPQALLITEPLGPRELLAVVGRLDLLVGMRLHALIFAAARAVPAVGVSYDPKVSSFCASAAQPYLPATQPEDLLSVAQQCWQERHHRAQSRRTLAEQLAARAQVSFAVVERLCARLCPGSAQGRP